jgi:hypothetical protein
LELPLAAAVSSVVGSSVVGWAEVESAVEASVVEAWAEVESVVASSVVVVVAAGTLAPVERQQPDWLR